MSNDIFPNKFKAALAAHQIQIGCWSALASPISTEVLGLAGFDWLVLDGEHAPNDISTFIPQLMALKGSSSAPVVRVPTNEPVIIKRLLDIGFYNFLIPFVENVEEAVQAVASTRYPPEGIRGVSVSHRANMFGTVPDYFAQSNKNITILVQIESQQGVDNVDAIAATEGVDGIFVGPSDLAAALDTSAMRLTRKYNALSSIFLPAPKHTANRAAFWLRLKLMPAATWNGARRLSLSAVTSAYSALPRKNWLIPLRNNHPERKRDAIMTLKVGFIGLGIMGKPMSKNLIKAGYSLVVSDRNPEAVAEVIAAGAETATTAKAIAEQCDVIITMLPNSPHVKEVALGENGIIEGAKPGLVVIDMSSIAPLASREISEALKVKGVDMLDAPVSGGEPKAIDGTLSVMVGGDKAIFDKYYDLLKAMAGSVVHTGEIGAGNVTKLANQVIVALNIAAMSEALTLATKAGVNPDLVYQAIRGGLAGSTVLDAKAPMVMDRNFKPGFRIDLHIKDLANALDTSHGVGAQLPLTAAVMEMMQALRADGLGTADHSAIACYYEKLAKVEVSR
jgi:2-hydroxy-3-oxopropionate reductase